MVSQFWGWVTEQLYFAKKIREIFRQRIFVWFGLSSNYGNCLSSWDQFMFCQGCKELPVEPWLDWKHVGSQYRWCSLALRRKLGGSCIADLTFLRVSLRVGATEAISLNSLRRGWVGLSLGSLQISLGSECRTEQKRKLHRFSTWETLARPAHRSSHNKAMDAESTFSARETVLTDVTFGPSLW